MDILIISIVSLAMTIHGLFLLGNKVEFGFIMFSISLLCQLYIFIIQENWILVIQMIVLIGFNLRNYRKWTNEKNKPEK